MRNRRVLELILWLSISLSAILVTVSAAGHLQYHSLVESHTRVSDYHLGSVVLCSNIKESAWGLSERASSPEWIRVHGSGALHPIRRDVEALIGLQERFGGRDFERVLERLVQALGRTRQALSAGDPDRASDALEALLVSATQLQRLHGSQHDISRDRLLAKTRTTSTVLWAIVWSSLILVGILTWRIERNVRDLLERDRRAYEELEAVKVEAEAANTAKTRFLANTSHEIRTPMTSILGLTESLMVDDLTREERREALRSIRRNGDHLLQIIGDILDHSKINSGMLAVESLPCDPCRIAGEVVELFGGRAREKGIRLDFDLKGPVPETIRTDPTRLRQILTNLLGNAIKFTDVGGVHLLASCAGSTHLEFEIVDTGGGMTADQAAHVFGEFAQADVSTTRMFGGTGLGLTIAKELANLLGGDVVIAETRQGVGSRFRATIATGPLDGVRRIERLPPFLDGGAVGAEPGDAADGPDADEEPRDLRSSLAGWRVLLVEDVTTNRTLVTRILEKAGAEVVVAENGKLAVAEALHAQAAQRPFDVVLMDLQMPVMDGMEATGQLRRSGYGGAIIALTAHAVVGDENELREAGFDDWATKPIDRWELVKRIRGCARDGGREAA